MAIENLNNVSDLAALKPEDIDNIGNVYGRRFADKRDGIKTNQVRNVYSSVMSLRTNIKINKKFTEEIKRELILLKPKMAYAAGRQRNVKPFYELLSKAIDATTSSKNQIEGLNNFIALVESIVAYHKYYGGKD